MGGHAKCYDYTQETLSEALTVARREHRRDGIVTCGEALVEALLTEAQRSARKTATFIRVGIRFLGGGAMDEGLLGQVRDCERLVEEPPSEPTRKAPAGAVMRLSVGRRKPPPGEAKSGSRRQAIGKD